MTKLNLKNITDTDLSEVDYDRHAGYKKYSASKTVLYSSNNLVTEQNSADKAIVSPILKMSLSNGLLSYYIYDIEANQIIEVTTYPEYDYLSINTRIFKLKTEREEEISCSWIIFNMMKIISKDNIKLSEEALILLKTFAKTFLDNNPTAIDTYIIKFDLSILE